MHDCMAGSRQRRGSFRSSERRATELHRLLTASHGCFDQSHLREGLASLIRAHPSLSVEELHIRASKELDKLALAVPCLSSPERQRALAANHFDHSQASVHLIRKMLPLKVGKELNDKTIFKKVREAIEAKKRRPDILPDQMAVRSLKRHHERSTRV